jgi:hypothetical protein
MLSYISFREYLLEAHLVQALQQGFVQDATQGGKGLGCRLAGRGAVHLLDVDGAFNGAMDSWQRLGDLGPLRLLGHGGTRCGGCIWRAGS